MLSIPETHVQHAFDVLKSPDHATARAAYEFADKQLKVILAKSAMNSNAKTVAERDASALMSDEYERALNDFRKVAELYYRARDRREAAVAIIDAWRTQSADQRLLARIG